MGFVGVLTGLVVVGLEMQTFDIHMLSVAPVGIFGFLQYIVLTIIGHLDITHPGMHEFNDEGTGLFLLLFLLVFLFSGIKEELIVGRTVLRLTQQHLHSIDLEFLKYYLPFQKRHQTEVTPYLLYKQQLAFVLILNPDFMDTHPLGYGININLIYLNFRIQFFGEKSCSKFDDRFLHKTGVEGNHHYQ